MKNFILYVTFNLFFVSYGLAQPLDLKKGLVAHWSFDDCSGLDSSVSQAHGTLIGSPRCDPGVSKQSLYFEGQNSFVDVGNFRPFLGGDSMTITAWVKQDFPLGGDDGFQAVVTRWENSGGPQEWWFGLYNDELHFTTQGYPCASYCPDRMSKGFGLPTSCWTFIGVVLTGNKVRYIKNGKFFDEDNAGYFFGNANTKLRIGRQNPDNRPAARYKGGLDEVRIYKRALSQNELDELYRLSAPISTNSQVAEISGIINSYFRVTDISSDKLSAKLSKSTTLCGGANAMIIQMTGAECDVTSTSNYGSITSLNKVGNFEFVAISSVQDETVYFQKPLSLAYNPQKGIVQFVIVPSFSTVTVTGPLSAQPWNGETGGILSFISKGDVLLKSPIITSGLGFHGGKAVNSKNTPAIHVTDYFNNPDSSRYALKGQGIIPPTQQHSSGRGGLGNAGGGGNNHNAGGGGGANAGCGGKGGWAWNEGSFSGDYINAQGLGGYPIDYSTPLAILGGGGGAGHSNEQTGSDGGNGGGIIIISAKTIIANGYYISSDGINAKNAAFDGAGGGGGGGSVILNVANVPSPLQITCSGGNGGGTTEHKDGPGGGGGGGVIMFTSSLLPTVSLNVKGGTGGKHRSIYSLGETDGCIGIVKDRIILRGDDNILPVEDEQYPITPCTNRFSIISDKHEIKFDDNVNISNALVLCYNSVGIKTPFVFSVDNHRITIDASSMSLGVYFLSVILQDKNIIYPFIVHR